MKLRIAASLAFLLSLCAIPTQAQVNGWFGFEQVFGYKPNENPASFRAYQIAVSSVGNVCFPNERPTFEFQIQNQTDQQLKANGRFELIEIGTRCRPDSLAPPDAFKIQEIAQVPVSVDIAPKGFANVSPQIPLPAKFGAYAIVLHLEGLGRTVVATCVRSLPPTPGAVQYPVYTCDIHRNEMIPLYERVGIKGTRQELGMFNMDDANQWARLDENMRQLKEHNVTVMLTLATGGDYSKMPLGRIRGFLNQKNEGKMDYPGDFTCLPQYDEQFQKWTRAICERYGWPKGPLNAVELWNEPWEGISISGWGADMPRFRELYIRMAQGVEDARKSSNCQVLIGGACSSMNTEDKFFGDGNDEPFLKWLDFNSIHYQPMCPEPVLIKKYVERKHPNGKTRTWDTESWIANSEDRVAPFILSSRATGLDRTSGVIHNAVREEREFQQMQADGTAKPQYTVQALPPAVAIGAMNHFVGQRPFKELLFKNGLPWVMVFGGLNGEEDGTVSIVGDLGNVCDRNLLLFRSVLGHDARKRSDEVRVRLAELPADAPQDKRRELQDQLWFAELLDNATIAIANAEGKFHAFDHAGNEIPSKDGKLVLPLNQLGYYVRTDGSSGKFAKLLSAIREARIEGYEPVEVVAHDLLAPVDKQPELRLTLTNILNRPLEGTLEAKLGELTLDVPSQKIRLEPHETRTFTLSVKAGTPNEANSYPLSVSFDAGADGRKSHTETLHANLIARRSVSVDGNLDDWKGALPQPIRATQGSSKNLTEKAWLPFVKFEDPSGQGYASGFVAYDDQNFYFAAKIADNSAYAGNVRFATRDDDSYFYPDTVEDVRVENGQETKREKLQWPAGVRKFSYRRNPDLPSGAGTDNVQIAFNVLPVEKTAWISNPPGVMPRFTCYKTTDYEYALNQTADAHGGGAELWRLIAPGVPRKHYYPRQNKVPSPGKDGGLVEGGKLVIKREGNVRFVECSIPWTEIPDVQTKQKSGEPIKFTFRINDNGSPSYELNEGRSVSKADTYALHDYWATSWAVETEFAFEK